MTVIDEYLKHVATPERAELERIRRLVHSIVPGATELISYGVPCFDYLDRHLIFFAAAKHHLSIFPGAEPVATFQTELKDFHTSKGTIRFTVDHPIPEALLHKIIEQCMHTIEAKRTKLA